MSALAFLIPVSIGLGGIGLVAFLWTLRTRQYDDLDGAAERILYDERNLPDRPKSGVQLKRKTNGRSGSS